MNKPSMNVRPLAVLLLTAPFFVMACSESTKGSASVAAAPKKSEKGKSKRDKSGKHKGHDHDHHHDHHHDHDHDKHKGHDHGKQGGHGHKPGKKPSQT